MDINGAAIFRQVCYAEKIQFIVVLFFNFSKTIKYPFSRDKRKREVKGKGKAHPRTREPDPTVEMASAPCMRRTL